MATPLVIAALLIGLAGLIKAGRQNPIGFTTLFLGLHIVLVGSNFLSITLHTDGIFSLFQLFSYNYTHKAALPLGNGIRPALYLLCSYASIACGIWVFSRLWPKPAVTGATTQPATDIKKYLYLSLAMVVAVLAYKTASSFYLTSPLGYLIQNPDENPASISSYIDTDALRSTLPYLMYPPIYEFMTQIVFTTAAFMFFVAAKTSGKKTFMAMAYVSLALLLAINFAYLKRAPIFIIAIFFFIGLAYAWKKHEKALIRPLAGILAVCIVCALSVDFMYSERVKQLFRHEMATIQAASPSATNVAEPPPVNTSTQATPIVEEAPAPQKAEKPTAPTASPLYSVVRSLSIRVLIGEGLEKFYAVEHWGTTYPYAGSKFIKLYMSSIAGNAEETFGEYWYRQIRPDQANMGISTAQDLILEMYIYFGPAVAYITAFLLGLLLMALDRLLILRSTMLNMPLWIGAIVLTGMMASRGFWSMFFAGGMAPLLLLAAGVALVVNEGNPLGRLYAAIIRKLP